MLRILVFLIWNAIMIEAYYKLEPYNINLDHVYSMGISSGGYMATQMHFVHSSLIKGAAILAAGPYHCSGGNLLTAVQACSFNITSIQIPPLAQEIKKLEETSKIDSLAFIKNAKVFLSQGKNDNRVVPSVGQSLKELYEYFGANVVAEFEGPNSHCWPTYHYGNDCTLHKSPFICKCDYDFTQQSLSYLFASLNPPVQAISTNLHIFDQRPFFNEEISMNNNGFIYVPQSCLQMKQCKLLIVFHGCSQTFQHIGQELIQNVGINEYAESNHIIVLYPQVKPSLRRPQNPLGCWDWWGYTSKDFDTKLGKQVNTISQMINSLIKQN